MPKRHEPDALEIMGLAEPPPPPKPRRRAPAKRRAPRKAKALPSDPETVSERPPEPKVVKRRAPRKTKSEKPKATGTADFMWDQRYQSY